MKERLQKILARAGVASRRAAEELIVAGRVRVNGRIVTELGATANPRHDRIDLDGKRVVREPLVYLLYHKPRAMVATMKDPEGRPAVGEVVAKIGVRVVPVGRLDFHTSGALLLTNDGELTDALLHPRRDVPKVYVAKMRGSIDVKELDALRNGVVLDDGEKTKPADVFVLREEQGSTWVEITLYEGRNRQIHRMGEAIGHPVLRLARLSFAGISTEGLRPGQWRPLEAKELERLVRDWVTPRREHEDDKARGGRGPVRAPRPKDDRAPATRAPARAPRHEGEGPATRGPAWAKRHDGERAAQGKPARSRDEGPAPRGAAWPKRHEGERPAPRKPARSAHDGERPAPRGAAWPKRHEGDRPAPRKPARSGAEGPPPRGPAWPKRHEGGGPASREGARAARHDDHRPPPRGPVRSARHHDDDRAAHRGLGDHRSSAGRGARPSGRASDDPRSPGDPGERGAREGGPRAAAHGKRASGVDRSRRGR